MPRRFAPYLLLLLALGALAWAVSFGTLPPADFAFCNGDEIKTVDPAFVTGQPEGRIIRSIFEGLVNWDPKTLQPIPGQAESWNISDDKLTYTFHLREDALWSNGEPVTADDIVWSMRRFLHPTTGAEYAYEWWYIEGAEKYTTMKLEPGDPVELELPTGAPGKLPFDFDRVIRGTLKNIEKDGDAKVYVVEIDGRIRRFRKGGSSSGAEDYRWLTFDFRRVGMRAVDSRTVEFRLRHPTPYFLNLMGFYPIFPVNPRCLIEHGYPAWTKPENIVSNGAFRLKFRRIRDRIRMEKSPNYWDRDNVRLNTVDALAVKSYTTMLNLYLTGEVDWISTVPGEVVEDLLKREQGDFRPEPYLGTYYYRINTRKRPLEDIRVRRALALALDKRQIVETITKAGQIPATSLVPRNISEYVNYRPAECEPRNVEKARALLAEAGFPGGKGFPRVRILYNTSDAHQAIAELIQSQWKRGLGIDVGLENQEWAAFLTSTRQGEYDIARAAWIGDYVDPNTFLDMFVTDGANNQTGWGDSEYDRLLEAAKHETDDARRAALFHEAETILMRELPIIPVYYYVSQSMVRPYVKGFYRNIQDVHPLRRVWIDQEEKARVFSEEGLK